MLTFSTVGLNVGHGISTPISYLEYGLRRIARSCHLQVETRESRDSPYNRSGRDST